MHVSRAAYHDNVTKYYDYHDNDIYLQSIPKYYNFQLYELKNFQLQI